MDVHRIPLDVRLRAPPPVPVAVRLRPRPLSSAPYSFRTWSPAVTTPSSSIDRRQTLQNLCVSRSIQTWKIHILGKNRVSRRACRVCLLFSIPFCVTQLPFLYPHPCICQFHRLTLRDHSPRFLLNDDRTRTPPLTWEAPLSGAAKFGGGDCHRCLNYQNSY